VTSFLFRASPVTSVYGGPMFWTMDESTDMLHYWQDLITKAPEELYGFFGLGAVPPAPPFPEKYHGQNMGYVQWCYTGPQEKAEEVFKPIRNHRQPAIDFAGPITMPAINSMFDGLYPAGYQWYWQADFFKHYDDTAIDKLIKAGNQMPTVFSNIHIYPINGAAGRVGPHETPWGYRDANFSQVIVAVDPDRANNERIIRWAKDTWSALHPHSAGGAYLNFKMDEGEGIVKAGYGDNYIRLAQIKAKYDPSNFFHINQNIHPKA
jgi:hypothetical protein